MEDSTGCKGTKSELMGSPCPGPHNGFGCVMGSWLHDGQKQGLGSSWPPGPSSQLYATLPISYDLKGEKGLESFLAGSLLPLLEPSVPMTQTAEAGEGFLSTEGSW